MQLSQQARANHIHPKMAYRRWRQGMLPVPHPDRLARTTTELVEAVRCAEGDLGPVGWLGARGDGVAG